MTETLTLRVEPPVAAIPDRLKAECARQLRIRPERVLRTDIVRRSIDARQRKVFVNLTVRVHVDVVDTSAAAVEQIAYPDVHDAPQAIVVGAGPAGLFAALELIELGIKPVILERGKDVDSRRRDMTAINREGIVAEDSNYCFGEGGAGAYSDGKLYTRSKKRGPVDKVLKIFHLNGAQADILVDAHPHIGSDRLPAVIKSMRECILAHGGEVHFGTRVTGLRLSDDGSSVTGVTDREGNIWSGPVILATGHSARDVYRMLYAEGVELQPKGIAVGVRLEHPQHLIDQLQYHSRDGRGKYLPAAEYSMLTRVADRAVYSFCMCPGGYIIPAASAPGQLVVNGMSPANRGTRWANSGMVVEVLPDDIPDTEDAALKMMHFQESIESAFFESSGHTQQAPAQRMTDFVEGRLSSDLPRSSYPPGLLSRRIDQLLPEAIASRLQAGFRVFGAKQRGFLTSEAVLVGDETRTSSPVRIPRNPENMQHIVVSGLYPCGEGAGYAGGIVSAAIDGIMSARALAEILKDNGE